MPNPPHETLVSTLHEKPELLLELVRLLVGAQLDPTLKPADSNLRFADPEEVRPDLVLVGERRRWIMGEVQDDIDDDKRRRWLLAASVLFNEHGQMGDVLVLTASRRVARWAATAAVVAGELGSRLELRPIVLHLAGPVLAALLDPEHPELAIFAAWAMHHRHGPRAKATVQRALELTATLPPPLREAQMRAIFNVLSKRMLAFAREVAMDPNKIPETPWYRAWRLELEAIGEARGKAEGEARGQQQALLAFLSARGLHISAAQQKRIQECTDLDTLARWIQRAATAASVDAALEPAPSPPKKKTTATTRTRPAARRRASHI
jgi:hypothetical protein